MRNSFVISPPVNRNVRLNSRTGALAQPAAFHGVCIEPVREAAVRIAKAADHARVVDGRVHLQAVAHDAGIAQQACALADAVPGHRVDVEAVVCAAESFPLAQHGFPAQPCLVDLQHQSLEQHGLVAAREPVFLVVVRPVQRMPAREVAVRRHARQFVEGVAWPARPSTSRPCSKRMSIGIRAFFSLPRSAASSGRRTPRLSVSRFASS